MREAVVLKDRKVVGALGDTGSHGVILPIVYSFYVVHKTADAIMARWKVEALGETVDAIGEQQLGEDVIGCLAGGRRWFCETLLCQVVASHAFLHARRAWPIGITPALRRDALPRVSDMCREQVDRQ
jgi:hypothetical protein